MSKAIIIREYLIYSMFVFYLIFATVKIIRKKRLLTNLRFDDENTKKLINRICIPIVYAGIFFYLYNCFPIILDLPAVLKGEYCVAHAIARSYDHADPKFYQRRYIDMEIENDIVDMTLYSYEINEGEEYLMVYLPHSKVGQIILTEDQVEKLGK